MASMVGGMPGAESRVKKVKKVTKSSKLGGDGSTEVVTTETTTTSSSSSHLSQHENGLSSFDQKGGTDNFVEEKMFCHHCDDSLAGHRYVLRDDHPYCINKIIGIDSKDLSYKEKHWHEACFVCTKCRTSLVDKQFGSKADRIYCGSCYDSQFATRCDGCGDVFRAGMKKMEYKNETMA
ncbi:Four and a half LIM domains protein 2 [Lepeophtheirus salmonis]|uniref:Four and a half LIM domains protein 2 n=1 Tax=Lepeophtheirus salmonis TaxID=72036 RepID=A0A7R8H4X8_LEPSM|nr:Four and a half LIM domains protein 2 [Lepeophtheirus salmonis]CAF2870779.1 Four and a half LIM domains protein 2 [Lepeophtheirus salmonis]